jgi:hypothetical protein
VLITFKVKGLHTPVTLVEDLVCLSTNLVPVLEMVKTWNSRCVHVFYHTQDRCIQMDRQTDTPSGMHKCQQFTLSITDALQYMQELHSEKEKSQRMKLLKLNIRNYYTECFLMP